MTFGLFRYVAYAMLALQLAMLLPQLPLKSSPNTHMVSQAQPLNSKNIFKDLEQLLLQYQMTAEGFVAEEHMNNAAFVSEDSPKEIEIFCPGPDPPIVSVRELPGSEYFSEDGSMPTTCLSLKLTGVNFNAQLSINCDNDNED
jgi:hypothetical protein